MTWARLDDDFPTHRKIRRLSDGAFRLHVTGICYSAHDLTDGRIEREDLEDFPRMRGLPKALDELVAAGLWQPNGDGWDIHDYLHYNPSAQKVEEAREAARIRQERKRRRDIDRILADPDTPVSHGVTNGVTHAQPTPLVTPPRPSPTRPVP